MKWFVDIGRVMRREFNNMLHNIGLLVFFTLLPLAYPVVYTLIYNPEVVREIPVAVVDDSRTPESRELVRQASAAPAFRLYGYADDMGQARRWWAQQRVYGVLHIPSDYGRKIGSLEQAHVTMYCDMSLMIRYRALLSAMSSLQIQLAQDITAERLAMAGAEAMGQSGLPIQSANHFIGDAPQGFASFVIPGIVVLILQQSLMIGVAYMGASMRDRRRANRGLDPFEIADASSFSTVIGKSLSYMIMYIIPTIYLLRFIPAMFSLPHIGDPVDYLLFIFPMVLATTFLGQTLVAVIREREYVFVYLVFTSVVVLFLSGITWPRYAMPKIWYWIGNLIPSTHAVEGFVRINSNGATISDNAQQYYWLWGLCLFYFVTAWFVTIYLRRKAIAKASAHRSPSMAADTMPPA